MVEFKIVVNDTKKGKSYNVQVSGHHANSLIGKKIGDEVDGIFISLPGYKLEITGGTDKDGFTMRKDVPGMGRRKILLSNGLGFHAKENGLRRKKSVKGNTINQDIVQINMKVTKYSSKPINKLLISEKNEENKKEIAVKEKEPDEKEGSEKKDEENKKEEEQ